MRKHWGTFVLPLLGFLLGACLGVLRVEIIGSDTPWPAWLASLLGLPAFPGAICAEIQLGDFLFLFHHAWHHAYLEAYLWPLALWNGFFYALATIIFILLVRWQQRLRRVRSL